MAVFDKEVVGERAIILTKALVTSLFSLWIVVVSISTHGVLALTNFALPWEVALPVGYWCSTPFGFFGLPALAFVTFGVIGMPSSWPGLTYAAEQVREKGLLELSGTIYKYLVPPLPITRSTGGGIFSQLLWALCREPCKYYEPSEYQKNASTVKDEIWIYINGIATTKDIADMNRDKLFELFGRPIHLVHNPTDSIFLDLLECVVSLNYGEVEPSKELKLCLMEQLWKANKENKKVVLIAHSQGTIITGNAVHDLGESTPKVSKKTIERLQAKFPETEVSKVLKSIPSIMKKRLEVYNFADCAHRMDESRVKYLENISNRGDLVAWLSHLFPFPSYWFNQAGDSLSITGESVIECRLWGHLLNTHYLSQVEKGKYQKSRLVSQYLDPSFRKLHLL